MFKTIIAGTDGQHGRGAASLAQDISTATGAQLLLVGVHWEPPLPFVEGFEQVKKSLGLDLQAVRDELAPDATTRVAFDMSPPHALRQIADEEHADLIVVGSRRRTALQRLASTDHAMQVLHDAPCAVAVVPDDLPERRTLQRIGVGIDATPESGVALQTALELARLSGAELYLLAVASDVYAGSPNLVAGATYMTIYRGIIEARVQMAHDEVGAALERCAGVPAEGDVRLGDPATTLAARTGHCDLLVLGSRRWGTLRRLALGSTSERVIHHAQCPILVPPRGAVTRHDGERRETHTNVVF
jgi:nucleotide-binding universal stress UspA family protein